MPSNDTMHQWEEEKRRDERFDRQRKVVDDVPVSVVQGFDRFFLFFAKIPGVGDKIVAEGASFEEAADDLRSRGEPCHACGGRGKMARRRREYQQSLDVATTWQETCARCSGTGALPLGTHYSEQVKKRRDEREQLLEEKRELEARIHELGKDI